MSSFTGLTRLYQAVTAITSKPADELSVSRVVHLSYAAMYLLFFGFRGLRGDTNHDILKLDASSLHVWRRIFRRITVVLQDVPEENTLSLEDQRLVDLCFWWIHNLEVGVYYRRDANPAEEEEWRARFKIKKFPVSNHFVFLLAKIYPGAEPYWRLRMLQAMTEEERSVAIDDDEQDDLEWEEAINKVDGPMKTSDTEERESQHGKIPQSPHEETRLEHEEGET